ncbi:MAG: AraC family ligand binding domain-containing protein [Acutalibacteraceae bacterium]|nr:AraC family ligand binding domain-containing protein [Acutalibacteraceae bacterium]
MEKVYYEQKNVKLSCYNGNSLSNLPHFHSELEMIVCFSGKVNCFLSGQNFDFGAGDIVLAFPNQVHKYRMIENGDYMFYDCRVIDPRLTQIGDEYYICRPAQRFCLLR